MFAHDREAIAFAYDEYLTMMDHWSRAIPADRLLHLQYEDLIRDPEAELKAVLEFCNLPWEDECLRHDQNKRSVRTPSLWQVRQPIYQTSVERWRRFEPWLGPLRSHD